MTIPKYNVTIITPTYNRPPHIVSRAIGCIRSQTFGNFRHIVCSDGGRSELIAKMIDREDDRFEYHFTGDHLGLSGDGVRIQMLQSVDTDFVCFLDDDNLMMPTYLEKMIGVLTDGSLMGETANFSICQCLHFGPLQAFHGSPPVILKGVPPKLYHIDMGQCLLRTEEFKRFGSFQNLGYYSDGTTYEIFAKENAYIEVPEILFIHLNEH